MKPWQSAALLPLALLLAGAEAPEPQRHGALGHYDARLSARDHFRFGRRLTSVAAILRQDRIHYHVLRRRDRQDRGERYFAGARNRALLERMVARGRPSPAVRRAIRDGAPLVHVDIHRDRVEVTLR